MCSSLWYPASSSSCESFPELIYLSIVCFQCRSKLSVKFLSGIILNIFTITGPSKGFVLYLHSPWAALSQFHVQPIARVSLPPRNSGWGLAAGVHGVGPGWHSSREEPRTLQVARLVFQLCFCPDALTVPHNAKVVVSCHFRQVANSASCGSRGRRLEVSQGSDFSHSHLCLSFTAGCFQKHSRGGRAEASCWLLPPGSGFSPTCHQPLYFSSMLEKWHRRLISIARAKLPLMSGGVG